MDCRNEGYWGDIEGWDNGSFLLHQSSLGASVHLPLWLLISLLPCSSPHLASEALLLVPLASPPPASVANYLVNAGVSLNGLLRMLWGTHSPRALTSYLFQEVNGI